MRALRPALHRLLDWLDARAAYRANGDEIPDNLRPSKGIALGLAAGAVIWVALFKGGTALASLVL
ncbi:hypothetical protein [Roseomonas elaeocarpi]|uniref:Uncharacterized protein n=1 Tax=Roseomonas elaeocarpi TaxID=907779 RepID=A0ABV6JZ56_9PROT